MANKCGCAAFEHGACRGVWHTAYAKPQIELKIVHSGSTQETALVNGGWGSRSRRIMFGAENEYANDAAQLHYS